MFGPTKTSGVAYPEDMALLQRVYDRSCQDLDILPGTREANTLAAQIMDIFASGVSDEESFLQLLKREF
ncbi:MAG: hypothetical protein E5V62_11880 [Mesorhizobium sp.]|uniref:hypothetical protein n=1 Tax=Mesorhizobium sp. TaxID=1871066 RepID=UPI000FD463AA|nr:hypothetical protein [Mesorhizobium sp.]RVD69710.1 hypothetical protein EN751_24590 [Mesorhizobium sp. M4A.F.Ca.ET.029.04.2.1]TIW35344.1 MAG: hypothetical protein E5V62_11880 [Mesorhizobium sp.]